MVKIYIDAGHGGSDSGATANGLQEKNLTLDIAKRLRDYLNSNFTGHTIRMSRTTDQTKSLKQRTDEANNWGADFFLSIHINAGGGTGYEDYIHNSLSDTSQTARLRNTIHAENVKEQSFWPNRGKKKANFHVLRESRMSAMLSENGFIDTKTDADKLRKVSYLNKIAKGHAEGLAKAFNLKRKSNTGGNTFYRVVAGSYKDRNNANRQVNELKKAGFEAFIDVYKDNSTFYRVIAGSYKSRENAEAQIKRLEKAGFTAFIVVYQK